MGSRGLWDVRSCSRRIAWGAGSVVVASPLLLLSGGPSLFFLVAVVAFALVLSGVPGLVRGLGVRWRRIMWVSIAALVGVLVAAILLFAEGLGEPTIFVGPEIYLIFGGMVSLVPLGVLFLTMAGSLADHVGDPWVARSLWGAFLLGALVVALDIAKNAISDVNVAWQMMPLEPFALLVVPIGLVWFAFYRCGWGERSSWPV